MKAAEWKYYEEMAQDFPYFTGSLTEAVKAEEEAHWRNLSRQWWAEADHYEDLVLERAWASYERYYGASWYLENCQYEEETEQEAALTAQTSREIREHLSGRDTVLWDKEEGEEVKSASVVTASVKNRGRALRRRNNAAHRGKSERGESPFFQTAWLKRQAAKGVRRCPSVPSKGGFKKVISFYSL